MPVPPVSEDENISAPGRRWRSPTRFASVIFAIVLLVPTTYVVTTYEFVPSAWRFVERRHPALGIVGTRSFTSSGIPADPLNIAFVGSQEELQRRMLQAGWVPADPITLKSSLRIAVGSIAHRSYAEAPVSNLFVNGKRQNLTFEQAAGADPSTRHHGRFWLAEPRDAMGRPLWVGAATYDSRVGLSHTTGQVTHHIAPDVDRERDKLVQDLRRSGVVDVKWVDDFQHERQGRNGGGDAYFTDGRLAVIESREPASTP